VLYANWLYGSVHGQLRHEQRLLSAGRGLHAYGLHGTLYGQLRLEPRVLSSGWGSRRWVLRWAGRRLPRRRRMLCTAGLRDRRRDRRVLPSVQSRGHPVRRVGVVLLSAQLSWGRGAPRQLGR
jgi:hypothetical protein